MKHLMVQLSQWEEYISVSRGHWSGDTKQQVNEHCGLECSWGQELGLPWNASPEQGSQGHSLRSSSAPGEECSRMTPEHLTLFYPPMILSSPCPLPVSAPEEISSSHAAMTIFPGLEAHPSFIWQLLLSAFSISTTLLRVIRPTATSCLQHFFCFEICIVVKRWVHLP